MPTWCKSLIEPGKEAYSGKKRLNRTENILIIVFMHLNVLKKSSILL